MYYTLERRAYFFKCFTISSAALASHSNKCPPLCWYNMTSYSTRPWETNGTNRDGHWLLYWYCDQKNFLDTDIRKIWPIHWRTECFSESEEAWTNKQYYTCSHSHVLLRINISPEVKGQWEFILPPSSSIWSSIHGIYHLPKIVVISSFLWIPWATFYMW